MNRPDNHHPLAPEATVPEVIQWLWEEIPYHSGRRGTKALTDGLAVTAFVLTKAAGLPDPFDDDVTDDDVTDEADQ